MIHKDSDGATTLVLVWENRWASAFGAAVTRLNGTLVASDRVPRETVERALAAQAAPAAGGPARPGPSSGPDVGTAAAGPEVDEIHAQLTKLGELRQAGLLTDEEFAAQKARILPS